MLRGVDLKVFTCESEWDAMLSCIYDAYSSGLGHKNIRLMTEPVGQMNLFDDYIHITPIEKCGREVFGTINWSIYPVGSFAQYRTLEEFKHELDDIMNEFSDVLKEKEER